MQGMFSIMWIPCTIMIIMYTTIKTLYIILGRPHSKPKNFLEFFNTFCWFFSCILPFQKNKPRRENNINISYSHIVYVNTYFAVCVCIYIYIIQILLLVLVSIACAVEGNKLFQILYSEESLSSILYYTPIQKKCY